MRSPRILVALLLLLLGGIAWAMLLPVAGRLDVEAIRRIQQHCGSSAQCRVRIGDLFDGDWDTFYEFGRDVPQARVNQIVGLDGVLIRPDQRLLVFMRNGHVVARAYERDGFEHPVDGEMLFEEPQQRNQLIVCYPRETLLRVEAFAVTTVTGGSGHFYVLNIATPK